jgi:photosystem II stability/assembly factor-like uncharacterized protein
VLTLLAGLLVLGAAAGGGAWYATRCDQSNFRTRAATSWVNSQDKYLYTCGQVWHSLDAGQTWAQISSGGLPLLAREGRIAVDIAPGHLYLGLLLSDPSTLTCPLCPLTRVEPAIYASDDGGRHWKLIHTFSGGHTGVIRFRQLTSDPNYPGSAWAIIQHETTNVYYATNTSGRAWLQTCVEVPPNFCDPPADFMAQHFVRHGEHQ